jgi:hypothetical protein
MTTATAQQTIAGTKVCTIGRDGSRMAGKFAQVFTGKIYEATARKDGVLTWRLVGTFGGTRSGKGSPSALFVREIMAAAPHAWMDVVQNEVCS